MNSGLLVAIHRGLLYSEASLIVQSTEWVRFDRLSSLVKTGGNRSNF